MNDQEQFENGLRETLLYRNNTGNPNAPWTYKTTNGYRLGNWQNSQRVFCKKGKLSADRIKRLEEIGFVWRILKERFEEGFKETLLYIKNTGNPNAPSTYKTMKGYQLGSWQSTQRKKYKKGTLSSERIKRLENIGFKWRMR